MSLRTFIRSYNFGRLKTRRYTVRFVSSGWKCRYSRKQQVPSSDTMKIRRLSSNSVSQVSPRQSQKEFGMHWHFWNAMLAIAPACGLWYYLHFPVTKEMREMAEMQRANAELNAAKESNRNQRSSRSDETVNISAEQENNELEERILNLENQLKNLNKIICESKPSAVIVTEDKTLLEESSSGKIETDPDGATEDEPSKIDTADKILESSDKTLENSGVNVKSQE